MSFGKELSNAEYYTGSMFEKVEYSVYHINPVKSLQMVEADTIIYNYKFADRRASGITLRSGGDCDDVLI
jgi:hypothetical protein